MDIKLRAFSVLSSDTSSDLRVARASRDILSWNKLKSRAAARVEVKISKDKKAEIFSETGFNEHLNETTHKEIFGY